MLGVGTFFGVSDRIDSLFDWECVELDYEDSVGVDDVMASPLVINGDTLRRVYVSLMARGHHKRASLICDAFFVSMDVSDIPLNSSLRLSWLELLCGSWVSQGDKELALSVTKRTIAVLSRLTVKGDDFMLGRMQALLSVIQSRSID